MEKNFQSNPHLDRYDSYGNDDGYRILYAVKMNINYYQYKATHYVNQDADWGIGYE